jgi:hypothetical protein
MVAASISLLGEPKSNGVLGLRKEGESKETEENSSKHGSSKVPEVCFERKEEERADDLGMAVVQLEWRWRWTGGRRQNKEGP